MKRILLSAAMVIALATAAAAQAQTPVPAPAPVMLHGPRAVALEIVAAEGAFSARFGEVGIAQGMREFIDQKYGLAFTGGGDPARGTEVYAAYGGDAPSKLKLSWAPAEVFAAKSGDMAASWGRFTLTTGDPARKPVTGRYVTVWSRDEQGRWKAIMDIGEHDAN